MGGEDGKRGEEIKQMGRVMMKRGEMDGESWLHDHKVQPHHTGIAQPPTLP